MTLPLILFLLSVITLVAYHIWSLNLPKRVWRKLGYAAAEETGKDSNSGLHVATKPDFQEFQLNPQLWLMLQSKYSKLRLWMAVIITSLVLCSSLYVILSGGYDDATQKWAFASVGTIMGFWVKSPTEY